MDIKTAKAAYYKVAQDLNPYCHRIEVAGSVRREKPEVNDIEIVAILDTSTLYDFHKFFEKYPIIKGKIGGKYIRFHTGSIEVDLFFASWDNWGHIFAIRTGSADFSKYLAYQWVKAGYVSKGGYLRKPNGSPVSIREEEDLFNLLGIKWVEPTER